MIRNVVFDVGNVLVRCVYALTDNVREIDAAQCEAALRAMGLDF